MPTATSKWVIALLASGLCAGLAGAEQATQAPPAPQAQTPPPAPPAQGQQNVPGGRSQEVKGDFVTMLNLVLGLSADQQTQVKAIFESTRAKAKVIADDKTLSEDDKKAKIQGLRDATNAQIKPLLTPDQQKRFDELLLQLKQSAARPAQAPR